MYTIGQVSEMFQIPISTLRYYDKEGLFPNIERQSGIRKFSDSEIEALKVIECLKQSGLEIKDIKQFMQWCSEGSSTYPQRKQLFQTRKEAVEKEIEELNRTLCLLEFKCWYYETAIKDGSEENIQKMLPDKLPEDIQKLYNKGFKL
ncbi:MAG TPA: MerR family transcriptional regulator [Ruminococcaceae bacterium]|nr:MerR family transcriptional regulator [Oscillospiraceae bacterium]